MTEYTNLKWKRIIIGGIATQAIAIGALIMAIVGYTIAVVFGTGDEPNQGALQQFNVVVGTQVFPLLTILLTAVMAAWVVRQVDPDTAAVHGFAVGLFVALLGLAFGALDLLMVLRFGATVVAGMLGAKLGPMLFR